MHIGSLELSNLELFVGGVPSSALYFSKIKCVDGGFPKYWKRFERGYKVLAVVSETQALDECFFNACASWRLWWKSSNFIDGLAARQVIDQC